MKKEFETQRIQSPEPKTVTEIDEAYNLIAAAFSCAYLCDKELSLVENTSLAEIWLKIYQQTPHEKPGEPKPPDVCYFLPVTTMRPLDYVLYSRGKTPQPIPSQDQATVELYVHDNQKGSVRLEDYLDHFYNSMLPGGWAVGISPIADFQTHQGKVRARCLQFDFDNQVPDNWNHIVKQMELRNKVDPERPLSVNGFFTTSSTRGVHFHGHVYFPCDAEGQLILAGQLGTSLLMKGKDQYPIVDSRAIGHALRSLPETLQCFPSLTQSAETGCLRVTRSDMKETQPTFISF